MNIEKLIFNVLSNVKCDNAIEFLQTTKDGKEVFDYLKDEIKAEIKQLLEEYTNRIVENATVIDDGGIDSNGQFYEFYKVDKESITSQLEPFLKSLE